MSEYVAISKRKNYSLTFPSNTLRVRAKGGVSISPNVGRRFQNHFYATKYGLGVKLAIEVNKEDNKIRITPDDNGFSFAVLSSGLLVMGITPSEMREMEVVVGDYVSRNNGNTFVLAK